MTMSQLKTEADVLRRCLALGLVERRDVIAWADARIAEDDAPDVSLTDIALAGGRSAADVASLLRDVPGTQDRVAYLRDVFTRMRAFLAANPTALSLIAHGLYLMALDGECPSGDAERAMRAFDDRIEIARTGAFGDLQEIRQEVVHFLSQVSVDVVTG